MSFFNQFIYVFKNTKAQSTQKDLLYTILNLIAPI